MIRYTERYPEGPASAIAGETDEKTAWQILHDIAQSPEAKRLAICPDRIFIDGDKFALAENERADDALYRAPEGYSPQWALAASVFYIFMGVDIFHGRGGEAQHENTPIPIMRQGLDMLNALIAKCLSFHAERRPTLTEIAGTAEKELTRLASVRENTVPGHSAEVTAADTELDKYWPEEMK